MTPTARPAAAGRLARAVTAAGLGGAGLLLAAPAAGAVTVPPGVYVVDEAGVLSSADEQRLTQEITDLRRDTGQGLYVVFVDSFETNAQGLADDVARQRGLGTNDSVLAIAVEDRSYGLDSGGDASLQNQITRTYVGPQLSRIGTDPGSAEWLAAGTAAVQGLDDAADGTLDGTGASGAEYDPEGALPAGSGAGAGTGAGSSQGSDEGSGVLTAVLGAGAVAAAVGGGVLVARNRRKKDGGAVERSGRDARPVERDPLDEMSLEDLRTRAGSKLVAADDAIRSSEQELGFAMASYGEDAVRTFREDIDQAKEHMRASFQLQHQLDDHIPDTEEDQRSWLKEIIQRSDAVGAALASHQKDFDSLRDLENNVPEALERIDARLPEARARVQQAESSISALHGQYAESALAEVADNAAQARERLDFVETAEAKARQAWETQDRSTAALAVRAAEESLSQVDTLTEAVGKAEGSLRTIVGNLQTGLPQSEQDLAEAEALVANGSHPELAGPVAGMKTTLAAVRRSLSGGRPDPLDLLHQLEAAHRQLNTPLSGVRDAREQARQASQMLNSAIAQAQAQIDGTADFIGARRGAVGSEARTRLAEADHTLRAAIDLSRTDPVTALQQAQRASQLAERASELARQDVEGFGYGGGMYGPGMGGMYGGRQRSGAGASFGGGLGGALLGGILMNSMFNSGGGSWGGGGFGGFDGGGLGGGDFGGFGDISGGGF
ncbi:TPM domain-containing protein [Micrococcus endophyticus]|uniref:TPM domain-containing protein n=1 Tax=Micrococcus endophyticus TaxID=455343 RepID=UPI00200459F1|nr:TPM domain-containing protein [Micrococcus endophyticus]MCK6090660.1 TPM domain-containing protein [Micrococcus endophyticus]